MSTQRTSDLRRVIGVGGVAFTAFNCVVGVGIFGLPGLVAGVLGPAALLAYLVCLILIGLVALCLAEAGSRVPEAGGLYAYAGAAFGPVVGGVAGALLLFANSIGSAAALARFFIDTLTGLWPALARPWAGAGVLSLVYAVLVLVNITGARSGSRLSVVFGLLKLTPLVLLIVAGLFVLHPANLVWPALPPLGKVGEGSLVLVFAFIGIETGLNISGEARDPARTIPRAIALALGMIASLYIGLQLVAQGVLGPSLAGSPAPLVDMARMIFGPWGARLLVVLTLLSASGFLAADLLSSPRIGYALAHAGQLPRFIGAVHPRFGTPAVAIVLYAALVVVLAASGSFQQIALLSVAGTLVLYLICCLGVLRLRAKGVAEAGTPFVAPGGAFAPLAAAAIIVWLLSTLAWRELAAVTAFVAVAATVYVALGRGSNLWRAAASAPDQD
ncbi:MAG: APC family permease [bacterium]|nr:APC family permease [bacterium]